MAVSTKTWLIGGAVLVGALVVDRLIHPSIVNPYQSPVLGGVQVAPTGFVLGSGILSWNAAMSATDYEVQPTNAAGNPQGAAVQVTGPAIPISDLPAATQFVIVRGCNAVACGPWSTVQDVTLQAPAPGSVTNISAVENADGSVTVSWTVPQGAAYTELQHTDGNGNLASSGPITISGTTGQDFEIQAPANTATVTGLYVAYSGAVFHFRLRACN